MPATMLLVSAALLLLIDQATKAMAQRRSPRAGGATTRGIAIRPLVNVAAAGGMLQGPRPLSLLLAGELTLFCALVQFGPLFQNDVAPIALGCAIGGAAGNLFDRVRTGGVIDFIDLHVWPVFNVADMAIVGGAMGAALCIV
jgi:signal peptidase II